jgi:hypothetical protein
LEAIALPKILLERGDHPVCRQFEGDRWDKCGEGWGDPLGSKVPNAFIIIGLS